MVSYPHRVSSGTDPKTIIILTEGDDYDLEEGAPVLTEGASPSAVFCSQAIS
jgi:hypothetical protein